MQEHARIVHDIKLDDDLDFIEIIRGIEDSMGISFADDIFAEIRTLGQMHELICREAEKIPSSGTKCATSMSFYRLKAAINRLGPSRRLTPATSLRALPNFNYVKIIDQLEGWNAPKYLSAPGFYLTTGLTLAVNIPLAFLIGALSVATGLLTFILLLILAIRLMPARLPNEKTVGELANRLAIGNLRRLAEQGAAITPRTLWEALVHIVAEVMDIAPDRLSRESRFI